jgi:Mg-chelatase subunit ChlD
MEWSTKRKLEYLGILAIFLFIFVVLPFYFFIYEKPTCFDGFKNGSELGIDCGGSCRLLCSLEIGEPIGLWDPRVFRVSPGVYSVIAYLENPNVGGEVIQAPYTFKLFDSKGVLILERSGETFIPKGKTFAVFESGLETGERIPVRATFAFDESLVWVRNVTSDPALSITNKALSREEVSPRLDAVISNNSLENLANIEVVAIIFDGAGNAIGASRTLVERIASGESTPLVFTWPLPFETKAEVCEAPVDVTLVIDRSGSMDDISLNPPQPLTDVKDAAIFFVNSLSGSDQTALVSFANDATLDAPLTSNLQSVKQAIENIAILADVTQNTNITSGIEKAMEELVSARQKPGSGKVMIVLTDGVATHPIDARTPNYPEISALNSANTSKSLGINMFTIGLGKNLNTEFLKLVASSSEEFYLAPTANDLTEIYKQIATKICKKKPASIEIITRIYPDEVTP